MKPFRLLLAGSILPTAALLVGAAAPVTLKAASGALTWELVIGAPDQRFGAANPDGPAAPGPSLPGKGGVGPGDGVGMPGQRGPDAGGMPGPGPRGKMPGGGPRMGGMPGGGPAAGPRFLLPVGPESMFDDRHPTHGFLLRTKNKAGIIDLELPPPRLIAVKTDLSMAALAMLRPMTRSGYSSNVHLPGKGGYRMLVRSYQADGKPLETRFQFTWK